MSLLIFRHLKEGIQVITDTLATNAKGHPYLLVSKSYIVPHLDMVIGTTGISAIGQEWAGCVFSKILCRNIDMIAEHTPSCLRDIQLSVTNRLNSDGFDSTIYHFGYSDRYKQYVRYAFRSTSNYEAELITQPGFAIKPEPQGEWDIPETPADVVALAERVRAEQRQRPSPDQIHIGGELIAVTLTNSQIITAKLHAFSDLEAQWLAMNEALGAPA